MVASLANDMLLGSKKTTFFPFLYSPKVSIGESNVGILKSVIHHFVYENSYFEMRKQRLFYIPILESYQLIF